MIVVELDYLFENIDRISHEIETIKNSIIDIMQKNFQDNTKNFGLKWTDNSKIGNICNNVNEKMNIELSNLKRLNEKLEEICKNENKYLVKKTEIINVNNMKTFTTTAKQDMELMRQVRPIDIKLHNINNEKKEMIQHILNLKCNREHILLTIDELAFDIIVACEMINQKINNFELF